MKIHEFFLNHLCDEEPLREEMEELVSFLNHLCDEEHSLAFLSA